MDQNAEIRELCRKVLGRLWVPHEHHPATLHTRREPLGEGCQAEGLPPTTMIGTRLAVTIVSPRPDYDALKRDDDAYVRTLTFWQRLMRPRPFWRHRED